MYGFVNNAIKHYVNDNFGNQIWMEVKQQCALTSSFLDADQPYSEETIFKIAETVSKITQTPLNKVLEDIGASIISTLAEKYKFLMESRGENLKDYLLNLPNFHNRIMLIYPELTPPEFRISNVAHNSLHLHYNSNREGVRDFLKGYLDGLVKIFCEPAIVEPIESPAESRHQEVFKINW